MAEMAQEDLEESVLSGFSGLCLRDHETGETFCLRQDEETGETFPVTYSEGISVKKGNSRSGFKVPAELSKLGTPLRKETVKDTVKETGPEQVVKATPGDASKDLSCSLSETIAAEVSNCKMPAFFCRKRKNTAGSEGKTGETEGSSGEVCKLQRFLESREVLLRAVQLFLAALSLVSPGFFFPVIFIIKMMCHYRQHDETPDFDFNHHHGHYLKCYLVRLCCRVCREERITGKMLRVHSSFTKNEKKPVAGNSCPRRENCSLCA